MMVAFAPKVYVITAYNQDITIFRTKVRLTPFNTLQHYFFCPLFESLFL